MMTFPFSFYVLEENLYNQYEMKKIIILFLAFIVCVNNQSCGQANKKENQNPVQETIEHNGQRPIP